MPTYTKLKGVTDISQSTLCDQLEANLIEFFNWGLLGIGAFFNVPKSSAESRLRPVKTPEFALGRVWEPFRNNIIWESGVDYGVQPIAISGIYVNNTFYPIGASGAYSYYIDYDNGRVIFNNPISTNSTVQMEYSYRYVNFTTADTPWFRQVMYESFRIDDTQFTQYGSGVWTVLSNNRVQLPSVVVEVVPRRNFEGYQIGGGQKIKQDVLFHVFTENPWDRKTLLDVITYQNDKTIRGFDKNLMAQADSFAFTENGALSDNALTYPQLVAPTGEGGFYWRNIVFNGMVSQETISLPPLYQAVVRGTFDIIFGEL